MTVRSRSLMVAVVVALLAMMIGQGAAYSATSVTRPPGTVQPQPFAALPFPKVVAPLLRVTNGWYEEEQELKVIGNDDFHAALDFEGMPCGTPVLAAADGVAVATYQSGIERGGEAPYDPNDPYNPHTDWKDPVTGHTGWLGFAGLVVELQTNVVVPGFQNATLQYFHLAAVNPAIKWLAPDRDPDTVTWDGKHVENWTPNAIRKSQADIRAIATPVKRGQLLGWLGDTGINFGYNDHFVPELHQVLPRDRHANPPWDPQGAGATTPLAFACQLHLEEYSGRSATFSKLNRFDAMDLYARITGVPGTPSYNNPYMSGPGHLLSGPSPIFQRDNRGQFVFAG
jgi:hypothetical protein